MKKVNANLAIPPTHTGELVNLDKDDKTNVRIDVWVPKEDKRDEDHVLVRFTTIRNHRTALIFWGFAPCSYIFNPELLKEPNEASIS